MKPKTDWQVRMERQPHREAIRRLKEVYQRLSQKADLKEVQNETNSSTVCASLDPAPGGGVDDTQPGGGD